MMESQEGSRLSTAAIVAIVCNSVVGILILILFLVLYKACQVPSRPEKPQVFSAKEPEQRTNEHKYLLGRP